MQKNYEPNFFSFSSLNAAGANHSPLPSLDSRPQTDSVQCEIRYLSESLWRNYCAGGGRDIILPESLARCKVALDEWVERSHPSHTAEFQPFLSECTVELDLNRQRIRITCDAVVATILSLFETPETLVRQSDIERRTGVKGHLLSAVMAQLCMKRPKDGMATGLLQVPKSFDCIERARTHSLCFEQVNRNEDPSYRFHPR